MNTTGIIINIFALVCLIFALIKDKQKTKKALILGAKSIIRIAPILLIIVILIGLLFGFIPKEKISRIIGAQAGFGGIIFIALFGSVLHIPSIISFPLASSLLIKGAAISSVAVFITTLTMISVITLPLEINELGKKMALLRNVISFIIAIIIGLILGAIL